MYDEDDLTVPLLRAYDLKSQSVLRAFHGVDIRFVVTRFGLVALCSALRRWGGMTHSLQTIVGIATTVLTGVLSILKLVIGGSSPTIP